MKYTKEDIGCYCDGAFGDQHLREILSLWFPDKENDLMNDDDPETQSEAIDDCLDLLQDQTEDGLVWVLELGDLLLIENDEYQ